MNRKPEENAGFSYVEILVALLLLAIALVPALEALQSAVQGTTVQQSETTAAFHLRARLDELLAEPFGRLDAEAVAVGSPSLPTSYSDAAGATDRRLVYLSRYDGDNADGDSDPFTGIDPGLLWIRAEMENGSQSAETLITRR